MSNNIIQLLPDVVANQIAAGEVIQRPASAVKELLENAVDAEATQIQLLLKEGGKQLIQVIDNGKGMNDSDARLCFERHATSKLRDINDLFSLRTKGFRGEALASIASVAQVEMKTCAKGAEIGCSILNEACEIIEQTACQTPVGTNIAVKNLFYNVPARRNFLKSNQVELRHCLDEFQRVALAHPGLGFSVYHNGNLLFQLNPGNLKQRVVQLFGQTYKTKLIDVKEETNICNIFGFIGTPESAKKSRGEQFFFVNDRFIKSSYLHHAVMQNYASLMPADSYPLYVLFIEVDPARIDINVHPTKQEIKFEDERIIYTFLNSATKRALNNFSLTPSLDFEQDSTFTKMDGFKSTPDYARLNTIDASSHYFRPAPTGNGIGMPPRDWQQLFAGLERQVELSNQNPEGSNTLASNTSFFEEESDAPMETTQLMQLHQRYIIVPIKQGVLWVDQQAAHERILYERYLLQMQGQEQEVPQQQQLFPVSIEFSASDAVFVNDLLGDFHKLGFDLQPFGQNTFAIHALPAGFQLAGREKQVVEELLTELKGELLPKEERARGLAKILARKQAIPAGTPLASAMMQQLVDELFACETPYVSPSGQLTFVQHGMDEIGKWFKKINN